MKKLIYIKDLYKNKNLAVTLSLLLEDLSQIGSQYIWSFVLLTARGKLGGQCPYSDIKEAIKNFSYGYCMTWDELKTIANSFDQVINMVLLASEQKEKIQIYKDDSELYNNFPCVIEILDGEFWEVCISDENIINNLKNRYKNLEIKDV